MSIIDGVVRVVAHLVGWHTNACRGDHRCEPPRSARFLRNGWWSSRDSAT